MRPSKTIRNIVLGTTAGLMFGTAVPSVAVAELSHKPKVAAVSKAKVAPASRAKANTSARAAANTAIQALKPSVRNLSPRALETAVNAYYAYQSAHPAEIKKPYLYFVDFGQSQNAQRGYVFDMKTLKIVEGPFTVAQGSGSGVGVPSRFSNTSGSRATSLGLYLTGSTYGFRGHSHGRPYSSLGLRLNGKSKGYNDKALARGVVAHGAPYVTANRAGKSQGCPAMEPARAARLLPKLANGSVVFLFAPNAGWMSADRWANG
jgi:hypothetical protein